MPLLNDLVNFVLTDLALPAINKIIETGIALPAFPGLAFGEAKLGLEPGYALLGLDFTFT